jgi:hypothetical protein
MDVSSLSSSTESREAHRPALDFLWCNDGETPGGHRLARHLSRECGRWLH